ncbi:MAG: putative pyridoxine 5'-phosphate oxidase superfamily flavin-nucleotide-binding protein [Saprospiraceae bacterium]|jgi:predicted pyridoxine 5'-phosphate oxidase superfamily flavin-nucleotide-binding protein
MNLLSPLVKKYIDSSVLCWLATANSDGQPNVSPKELFTYIEEDTLVIANIASPTSIKNIQQNSSVCVSFVDVFVQKGYKLSGIAVFVKRSDVDFLKKAEKLKAMAGEDFPVNSLLAISVKKVSEVIAPRYRFYPETTEVEQIESAYRTYGVSSSVVYAEAAKAIGTRKQFEYYKLLGNNTFSQLEEQDLFWQYNPESNSIAIIVKHLWGNMLSRWTDFLRSDGEKEWRDRDGEFEVTIKTKEELIKKWNEGWECLFIALDSVSAENAETTVYIRNMGHTITEAVNRQLAHYAYHVGQIVFIGRMIRGSEWQSLSIPKGDSKVYNADKFSQPKRKAHFTDEFLK